MNPRTFSSSTLVIAVLLAACAGPEEEGAETSSLEQAAAAVVPPEPPPPPQDPAFRQCVLAAREGHAECVRANPDQEQACSDRFEAAARACPGGPPVPPPPPPEVRRDPQCVAEARTAYRECVRANPAEQEACGARLRAAHDACPPATTPPAPPPPPAR
jgi:hypothetical protein